MIKLISLVILFYSFGAIFCQVKGNKLNSNPCTSKETCSECITADPRCGWCMKRGSYSYHRCDFIHRLADHGCFDQIFFPGPSFSPILNEKLSNQTSDESDPIQMRPQRVQIKIRPKLPYSVRVQFKQAYIMDLIQDEYLKISSNVELKDNATDNVKITYFSSCLGQKKKQTNICKGLRVGDNVTFEVKIEVTSCPRISSEWNQTILVYPVGLNDALLIDLEMICECDCEKSWNEQPYSVYCGLRGTYGCGICSCNDNFYGRRCECDAKDTNPAEEEQACIRGNDTKVCSGRGVCRCGECECYKREAPEEVTGKFCEDCPTCKSQCETYKECVQCRIHQSGPLDEKACNRCNINPIGTSEFDVQEGEQLCVFIDDDDCKFQFKYKYDEFLIYVIAENKKDCPESTNWITWSLTGSGHRYQNNLLYIFFGVIVTILII